MPVIPQQTVRPSLNNNIALIYETLTSSEITSDQCIKDIQNLIEEPKFYCNFNYALYADNIIVQDNLFMPMFNTFSLCSHSKIAIIRSAKMINIISVYPQHRYVLYTNQPEDKLLAEDIKKAYPEKEFLNISEIKELIHELL